MTGVRKSKHYFRVGQRVRPSGYGIKKLIYARTKHDQSGVVTKIDKFGDPTVLWSGRKTPLGYYQGFIEHDRRKLTPPDGEGEMRGSAKLNDFGPLIAAERKRHDLGLQGAAELIGCTKNHLWQLEHGKTRNPTIKLLAGAEANPA